MWEQKISASASRTPCGARVTCIALLADAIPKIFSKSSYCRNKGFSFS